MEVEGGDYVQTASTETPDSLEPESWWLRFWEHLPVTSPRGRFHYIKVDVLWEMCK